MTAAALIECTTTFGSEDAARQCAQALVQNRLAACVQILGPIESVYRWEGSIHQDREWKLVIKSTSSRQSDLIQSIRRLHSYTEPEILILPILEASEGYARWLLEQTTPPEA